MFNRQRNMDSNAVGVVLLLMGIVACQGFSLYGEEKRQGLIPFPRVGRSFVPVQMSDMDDWDDLYAEEPLTGVHFVRAMVAPHLGRKKRSVEDTSSASSTLDVEDINDFLRRSPWALIAYKESADKKSSEISNRSNMNQPRLGRKRSEMSMGAEMAESQKRSNELTPRLGRSYADTEDADGRGTFNPRLGRSSSGNTFSPRLGRSTTSAAEDNKRA